MTKRFLVMASDIQWNIQVGEYDFSGAKLPRTVEAIVEVECDEGDDDDFVVSQLVPETLSEMLTDEYGFCHEGYDIDSCEPYDGDDNGIIEEYDCF